VTRILRLTAAMIVVVAILAGGCGGPAIKPLTDAEKEEMIEIALADPEVTKWLDEDEPYDATVGWSAVGWHDSEATGFSQLEYEEIADGKLPADRVFPSDKVTINPHVYIRINPPTGMHLHVAFDREKMGVAAVQLMPGRPSAGPTPSEESHPAGMKSLRPLTNDERARIIDTALFNTKAAKYLNEYNHYEIDVSWIAIVWEDSEPVEWRGIKSDWENDPNLGLVSGEAEFYSRVVINFGEPLQWQVMTAINPETGKVALAEENPFRTGPEPPE
jgi:hypothetical protein